MTPTVLESGQKITSTTTESSYAPDLGGRVIMTLALVSGSVQIACVDVGRDNEVPVIDTTYTTYSTAGDKIIVELERGVRHLHVVGSGVLSQTF